MATPVLSVVSWVVALFVTLFALIAFVRGLAHLWRQFSSGTPEPHRTRPVVRRLWSLVWAALSHREFRGRPLVKAAHWLVMLSFPVLFLTLTSAYVHLRDPEWVLPLLGSFAPWNWLVEFFAWGGLLGISALMIVRSREGAGSIAEAALSSSDNAHNAARSSSEAAMSLPDNERNAALSSAEAALSSPDTASGASASSLPRRGQADRLASRFLGSTRWQALFVEWVILIVCACVVVLRALDYALIDIVRTHEHAAIWWNYPATWWAGELIGTFSPTPTALANAIVVVSLLKIIASMVWLMVVGVQTSMGVAWHRFLAVANIYTRRNADGSKSLGPAAPMLIGGAPVTSPEAFDDLGDDVHLGAGTAADLSWKDRLDLYTCTECGRCQELCPAWNTAKPLSPKLLVLAMRDHVQSLSRLELQEREVTDAEIPGAGGLDRLAQMEQDGTMLLEKGAEPTPHSMDLLDILSVSGTSGPQGAADVFTDLVPHVVSEEALWDCTMCGACVDQCPVDIEHIDHVLDLRRHRVLMEAAFPRELGRAFRGMESKANPYNQPARKRMEWAKGLDFEVPVVGVDVESAEDVDWLFWVGCAGAFDDRGRATSAAVAELLHIAGVSFAVLGSGESCTGDAARRAGNEPLFQMLAAAAIDTLTEAKVQRIVVSCAHCFNTIAGEFPELGGRFDVVHHTQLLNRLVREGRLTPVAPSVDEASPTVTYHDPCYLGRHNEVYEPPRELVGALPGVTLVEMPRNRERAMCCGAGGAHAWFEETRGVRIADARIVEAAQTGADIVATGCPFCSQMLGSATGSSVGLTPEADLSDVALGEDDADPARSASGGGSGHPLPEVKDVAVMLLESVKRGTQQ